ncbi:hypothetical protein OROHE_009195 [Orobanche hederae]
MALSESDKRPYLPSTDEDGGGYKGKVCVICVCNGETTLFILDFNSADADADVGFIELPPALRFDRGDLGLLSFCVLGTQLYVIGADDGDIISDHKKLWMCEYDLDSNLPPNSLIDSTVLKNFEVFDPKLNQWKTLPQLYLLAQDNGDICLRDKSGKWTAHPRGGSFLWRDYWNRAFAVTSAGSFMSGSSTFLLTLDIGLMFTLNLDSLEEGWQAYHDPLIDDAGYEFVVAEPFVVTPHWVKDMRMMSRDVQLFPSVLPPDTTFGVFTYPDYKIIVLKYVDAQECCFTCTVTTGCRGDDEFPFLICSIRKHNIATDGGAPIPTDSFKYRPTMGDYHAVFIQNMFLMSFESSLRTKRLKSS